MRLKRIAATLPVACAFAFEQPVIDYSQVGNQMFLMGQFDAVAEYDSPGQFNTSVANDLNAIYRINDTISLVRELPGAVTSIDKVEEGYYVILIDGTPYFLNSSSMDVSEVSGWSDVEGQVKSLLVDADETLIYFGGNISYNDVYGAIAFDYSAHRFYELPFSGFNEGASVNAIAKIPDDDYGSIVFGGSFDSLGNTNLMELNMTTNHTYNLTNSSYHKIDPNRLVSLKYATVSATDGSEAASIVCPGTNTEWLTSAHGSWTAELSRSVVPSKVRLYNSKNDDTSVTLFRVVTSPANGIMNMTYVEPSTGEFKFCDAWCPLLSNSELSILLANSSDATDGVVSKLSQNEQGFIRWSDDFQEFEFYNEIPIDSVTVEVIAYTGQEGGLSGFELFQYGLYAYANETLNEPTCSSTTDVSSSETTGSVDWTFTNNAQGQYMSATFSSDEADEISVTFYPSIEYSGNYSVLLYTPGCADDNTCDNRGVVNASFYEGDDTLLGTSLVYQTNLYEKYDEVFYGHLNIKKGSPYLKMTYATGPSETVMVADKVYVDILGIDAYKNHTVVNGTTASSTIPIRNIFEYSLANFSYYSDEFTENMFVGNSSINLVGSQILNKNAVVNSLVYINDSLIIAGDFKTVFGDNFFELGLGDYNSTSNESTISKDISILGGLNGEVSHLFEFGNALVAVGDFDKTGNSSSINSLGNDTEFQNAGIYNGSWYAFGDITANISSFTNITVNGTDYFVFNGAQSSAFVWDYTNSLWLNSSLLHLNVSQAVVENDTTIAFGSIALMNQSVQNVVCMRDPDSANTYSAPGIDFASGYDNYVTCGFYVNDTHVIIGGHFRTSDGYNLVYLNTEKNRTESISGIKWATGSEATTMLAFNDELYIGISGQATVDSASVAGLIVYSLGNDTVSSDQPGSLGGGVNAIAPIEADAKLLVGGNFDTKRCSGICLFDTASASWAAPSNQSISGEVTFIQAYDSSKFLISGKQIELDGSEAKFVTYDSDKSTFAVEKALSSKVPDYVDKFIAVDNKTDGRVITIGERSISYFDGSSWTRLDDELYNSTFTDILLLDLAEDNDANDEHIFDKGQILLATGSITVENIGTFSAAYYNGSSWVPLLITTDDMLSVSSTRINSVMLNKRTASYFGSAKAKSKPKHHHKSTDNVMLTRNVVGVGFGLALGTTLLLGLAGAGVMFATKSKNTGQLLESRVGEEKMLSVVPPREVIDNFHVAKLNAT